MMEEIAWEQMEVELDDPTIVGAIRLELEDDKGNRIYNKLPK